ncbi:phage tail tube assembly chaperone [uncultured Lactobacillus sp.]|uniref:phage tail tube assembly chaperone n=1 Tax=uncultured Lactobacillus sp. TaxID=153152 RepID=UPI002618E0E7|nr:phage tail tube assembly chaperone [uncultured Lactobacillus sp.]
MSKIIIDTKILPIKADQVEVVPTGAVGDISRETMIKILESADPKKNEEYVDFIKRQADAKKAALDLLKLVLGLSTKQIDKINSELEESTIDNYVGYVESLLQGLATGSYADFEKAQKDDGEEVTDPKSDEDDD